MRNLFEVSGTDEQVGVKIRRITNESPKNAASTKVAAYKVKSDRLASAWRCFNSYGVYIGTVCSIFGNPERRSSMGQPDIEEPFDINSLPKGVERCTW